MHICHIVGAGPCEAADLAILQRRLASAPDEDYLIAADAGLVALQDAGIEPHMIVGDFDTLGYAPTHDNLVTLPVVKDVTDTFEAISQGREKGYRTFFFYGCLGGRIEHTIANLQHLAMLAGQRMEGVLIGGGQAVTAVLGPAAIEFAPPEERLFTGRGLDALPIDRRQGSFLSLFGYDKWTVGVTLKGLQYELQDKTLLNDFPLGISNTFLGRPAQILVDEGILLLVLNLLQEQDKGEN